MSSNLEAVKAALQLEYNALERVVEAREVVLASRSPSCRALVPLRFATIASLEITLTHLEAKDFTEFAKAQLRERATLRPSLPYRAEFGRYYTLLPSTSI
jgi:hypothetical protein